ncbi:MAG TPA: tetratricopeptide repeat protein [Terriglobia bacterium]|nr:tetratricopeptide repeat protein [Terriglobia bacterium]
MRLLTPFFVFAALPALAGGVPAQLPSGVSATGEFAEAKNISSDMARQLARIDADRQALNAAVGVLRRLPELAALGLNESRMEAFAVAVLDPVEQSTRSSTTGGRTVHQVEVVISLDEDTVHRVSILRKDREATARLLEISAKLAALRLQLVEQLIRLEAASGDAPAGVAAERQDTVVRMRVAQLSARVAAGLALTEESPASRRVSSPQGRERARRAAEEAVAIAPDSPEAHYAMGDVLMEEDQPEVAEAEYRKALGADSASASGHLKRANALRLEGKLPEAVAEFREAIRINPRDAQGHSDLALTLNTQGNTAEATAEYTEAIRLDPDCVDAHNGLAVILARQQRIPDAAVEFREIIRIDPDLVIGHYNLALALADLDMDAESAKELREVVRLNPNHYNAHYNLGELFRLEGKFDDAARQFREYLRLAPDTPQTQRNRQRAQSLAQSYEEP